MIDKTIIINNILKNNCNLHVLCQSVSALWNKACIDECEDIAELLVGYGADIDAEDRELWTPLHASAACENFAMVQYLVENGANVAAINADGNLPFDLVEEDEELRKYLHDEMNKHGKLLLPLNTTTIHSIAPHDHRLINLTLLCWLPVSPSDQQVTSPASTGHT